jgi:hypothetical protein
MNRAGRGFVFSTSHTKQYLDDSPTISGIDDRARTRAGEHAAATQSREKQE